MRSHLGAALAAGIVVVLAGAATAADGDWGTVKGQVTWGGAAPWVPEKVDVSKDKDHCLSKGPIFDEKFIVGKDGGVKDVIVWLQNGDDYKAKMPIHPSLAKLADKDKEVVMDQPCCKFEPRTIALREGQVLIGKNSSSIAHNMKWTGGDDNPGDNKLIPAGGKITIELVPSRSLVVVECNIHPWMRGNVRMFNHPYFAVTDADGKFEIKNAPAGKYNLVMWVEGQGWVNGGKTGQVIEIPAGKTIEVNAKAKP
jgi:hypothetical protein